HIFSGNEKYVLHSTRASISENERKQSDTLSTIRRGSAAIYIRLIEEPLTAQNVASILSAFTQLYTGCWLIVKGRFRDLIEYTQTHSQLFVDQAHLVINKITYNSPALFEF